MNAKDITAARDALEGFRRVTSPEPASATLQVSWSTWAVRLALVLANIIDALDEASQHALDEGQREVLAQALTDAIAFRDPVGGCDECERRASGLCDDHAADLDLTDAYLALAQELGLNAGIEVEQ